MAHVTVTHNSYGSRVGKSIGTAVVGVGLFLISFILLFWNDGRAFQTEKSLNEGSKAVVESSADKIEPNFDGKLVHMSGLATTDETLTDPDFHVSAPKAIKLVRDTEMYEWREHKKTEERKNVGGSSDTITTYSYDKGWEDKLIDSEAFNGAEGEDHQNPKTMRYSGETYTASKVTLGAHTLAAEQVSSVGSASELPVEAKTISELKSLKAVSAENGIYLGKDPSNPVIGDIKVHFKVINPTQVTIAAQQSGESFKAYQTTAGDALMITKDGTMTAPELFAAAQADNVVMTWILRIVGWAMMFIGLMMVFKPAAVLADVIPFVGTLVGASLAATPFLLASFLSFFTIAIAWMFYRPLLGIGLLVVAGGLLALYIRRAIAKKKANAAAGGVPPAANVPRAA